MVDRSSIKRRTALAVGFGITALSGMGGVSASQEDSELESSDSEVARPTIERFEIDSISDFEGDVDWKVSDEEGQLGRVRLTLIPRDGVPEIRKVDEVTIDVDGEEASGVTTLVDSEESII